MCEICELAGIAEDRKDTFFMHMWRETDPQIKLEFDADELRFALDVVENRFVQEIEGLQVGCVQDGVTVGEQKVIHEIHREGGWQCNVSGTHFLSVW